MTEQKQQDNKDGVATCVFCVCFGLVISLLMVVLADLCMTALRGGTPRR